LSAHGIGTSFAGMVGGRLRPFGAGLSIDVNGGLVHTGDLNRPGLDAHLGYDFRLGGGVEMGPQVGYTHVFQSGDALRTDDAKVVAVGFHVSFGNPSPAASRPVQRADRDRDGVFDDEDACADTPGVRTRDHKTNGCPSQPRANPIWFVDRDRDGIPDQDDACPDVPGKFAADPKLNGCPEPTPEIRIVQDRIILDDKIFFDFNVARVRVDSVRLVQKVAHFLAGHPEIVEVSIQGHADELGPENYNQWLSERRARAVRDIIVAESVATAQVTVVGYGKQRPAHAGLAETARRLNRRVEFVITRKREETASTPTSPATGPTTMNTRGK